jgi:D-glycero-alpha-D-manno-heptose 1-phosphate guanylyltransferase
MISELTCVILAGGLGTRLRAVLPDAPKVLAPVNGRPFLEYLVAQVRRAGCREIVLCVGYKAEMVEEYFGDGSRFGVRIRYSREDRPLGTAGALSQARLYLQSNPILVMNGDSYCEVDLGQMLEAHQANRALATLAAVRIDEPDRYGGLTLGRDNQVSGFAEKPEGDTAAVINGGIYLLNQRVLDMIPGGQPCTLEKEVFPALAGRGLYAFPTSGLFIDIGVPAALERAQTLLWPDEEARREGSR